MEGKSDLPATLKECIALGDKFIEKVHRLKDWLSSNPGREELFRPLASVALEAPIPRPDKNIFCVGKNYAEHAIEMGSKEDIPEHIMVFTKSPTTVIGHNETVLNHHNVTAELDYEGELAVVIGKKGRAIPKEEALDHIFGYTIINDVTARDLQSRHKQFFIGKSLDATCPMGPWIVHSSAIENPNQLDIQTKVNGELRQSSNTENFIFPIEEIISVLSKGMTLEPGDIIATGTPAGVGKGFKPPRFLQPGDKVEITVEKIGTLTNCIEK
jgi:2-keto-4-pentenoate hydratase/2-oxohepta-3-ene-1,7-dioic acid hydratase in catechol pathway